jgi:uncharacterized protein YndB with AHSA1/START domain
MPNESLRVWEVIPARPEDLYFAWLDSDAHTAMTGGAAEIADGVGSRFTAWDGYIEGTTLHLEPGRRIVQAWRTSEFPAGSPDSRLEIVFEAAAGGTTITILHSEIPDGQGHDYEKGWHDHYFTPMKNYFAKARAHAESKKAPTKKSPAKKARPARKAAGKSAPTKKKAAPKKKSGQAARKSPGRSKR